MREKFFYKKSIIIYLVAIMLISIMSITDVVNAAETIGRVEVYSENFQPVSGKKTMQDYSNYFIRTARIGNNENYSVYDHNFSLYKSGKTYNFNSGVIWEKIDKEGFSTVMTSGEVFEEGYSYKMYIALKTEGENTFKDNMDLVYAKLTIQGSNEWAVKVGDKIECITGLTNTSEKIKEQWIPNTHFCVVAITWNAPLKNISNYNVNVKNAAYPWTDTKASTSGISLDNESMTICNNSEYSPKWYDNKNKSFYSNFEFGKNYTLKIPVKIKSGYVLRPNIIYLLKDETVTINGFPAKVDYSDISDGIIYICQEYKSLKKAKPSDTIINYPLSEANPTYPTVVGDLENSFIQEAYYGYILDEYSGQTAAGVDWCLEDNTTPVKATSKLEGGKTYKLRIYLQALDGYAFDYNYIQSDSNKGKKTLKVYDNRDKTASNSKEGILGTEENGASNSSCYGTAKKAYIEREYTVYPRVREIKLSGFVIPNVGNHPVYNISTPYSCPIIEKSENNEKITWTDVTNGGYIEMNSDDDYIGGHIYEANVFFREQRYKGYAFPDNFSEVKINMGGVTAPLYKSEEDDSLFQTTQDFIAYNYIKKIIYNISNPEGGKPVVQQAFAETEYDDKNLIALCDNATIIDISQKWEQSDGGTERQKVAATDTYKGGMYYINSGLENIINNLTDSEKCNDYVSDLNVFRIDPNQLTIYINDSKVFEKGVKTTNLYGYNYVCYVPKKSIKDIEVTGIEDKTYTGDSITQNITVKLGDTVLVKDKDYTVTYEKNVEVGTATIIITGIGDYEGEIKKTFEIKKKEQGNNSGGEQGSGGNQAGNNQGGNSGNNTGGDPVNTPGGNKENDKPAPSDGKNNGTITKEGIGTFSADGKTLTDESGKKYIVSNKLTGNELKKNLLIADKKSSGKYKITKLTKNKKTGKITGGTVEYVAPYNKNTKLISATGKVKLGGVTFTVTSIAPNCAKGCKKLTKVVLGSYITSIGKNAFNGCGSLKTIQIKSKNLKKIGANSFKGINKKATISVPKAKKKAYTKLLKGKGQAKTVKIK